MIEHSSIKIQLNFNDFYEQFGTTFNFNCLNWIVVQNGSDCIFPGTSNVYAKAMQ